MKLGPYELDQIYTGDARLLAPPIPDESIDLIFTDPVYQNIDDYRWLAETANRVLKPNSAAFIFCGIEWLPQTCQALLDGGLTFRWQFSFTPIQAGGSSFWSGMMRRCWISGLWFEKGISHLYARIFDSMAIPAGNSQSDKGNLHQWEKGQKWMMFVLSAFSRPSMFVFDPFCGGGTVPAVCKMLGRRYLAFEIDPAVAERARLRVLETQPPLFIPEPEQLTLERISNETMPDMLAGV